MRMVRLSYMRRRVDIIGVGCLLALVTVIVLGESGLADPGTAVLVGALVAGAVAVGVPHTFWLREEADGLTVVRLLVPRRYAWSEIRGLAMEFDEEEETSVHRVTLRLRLVDPPGRFWGPLLGRFDVTDDDRPRGLEPRALAELFALFGRHGLPVDRPEFADDVLHTRGLPPTPPPPVRSVLAGPVPTAAEAYAAAPGVAEEQTYLAACRSTAKSPPRKRRAHLLRAAAQADRIALAGGDADREQVVWARISAGYLCEHDGVTASTDDDARSYVRQQYLDWRRASADPRRVRRDGG
ncbi:hypothetical protein [Kitasatospora sp. NPDC056273]|uniref:hypothetical protein n=1 Tax=Kitasatospora sp. NPDC056273 TaxID=3345769 RepID=UPI0035D90098